MNGASRLSIEGKALFQAVQPPTPAAPAVEGKGPEIDAAKSLRIGKVRAVAAMLGHGSSGAGALEVIC